MLKHIGAGMVIDVVAHITLCVHFGRLAGVEHLDRGGVISTLTLIGVYVAYGIIRAHYYLPAKRNRRIIDRLDILHIGVVLGLNFRRWGRTLKLDSLLFHCRMGDTDTEGQGCRQA